jgi:phage tail-like protein
MNPAKPNLENSDQLSLAVDHYNRYPGESATFYLRFTVPETSNAILHFSLPRTMEVESYAFPPGIPTTIPSLIEDDQNLIIAIPLAEHFTDGQSYEISVITRLDTFYIDHFLIAEAMIFTGEAELHTTASIQVAVYGHGKYQQYLPDFYGSDDFTSRFLMLFESFWKPISQQIDQVENYFSPDLTPPEFVPWLASWIGVQVDELLPLDRVRKLLKNAMMLFQCRGTCQALKTFLEIFSAGDVVILEHQAKNFVLGEGNTLGMGIALGTENQPGTISINLDLSRSELNRTQYSEEMYLAKISDIIRSIVPAHTIYRVTCEFHA